MALWFEVNRDIWTQSFGFRYSIGVEMGVQKISLNNYAHRIKATTNIIISFDLSHTHCEYWLWIKSKRSGTLIAYDFRKIDNQRTHACTHVGTHTRMHAHIEPYTHAHCPQCGNDNIDDVDLGQFTLNGLLFSNLLLLLLLPLLLQLICCTIQLHFYCILLRTRICAFTVGKKWEWIFLLHISILLCIII